MNLIRCSQGHFYDSDSYASCPYCGAQTGAGISAGDATVSISQPRMQNAPPVQRPQQPVPQQSQADFDKTVSIYSTTAEETPSAPVSAPAQPVVGWLVCVEGMDRGRDYRLIAGHNFIGRGRDMNVSIEGDLAISRSKHAILTYDPQANSFFVQPGESHELCYLNNKVVLDHVLLKQGDMLSLGNTKLLFVPCCTDAFNWGKDMKGGTGND